MTTYLLEIVEKECNTGIRRIRAAYEIKLDSDTDLYRLEYMTSILATGDIEAPVTQPDADGISRSFEWKDLSTGDTSERFIDTACVKGRSPFTWHYPRDLEN